MNTADATALADRIATIPGRHLLTHTEWVTELADLDAGTAGAALIRCLRDHDTAPTPRELRAKYATLHTPANDPIPGGHCTRCNNTGGITVWLDHYPPGHRLEGNPVGYRASWCYRCPSCRGLQSLAPPPEGLPRTAYDPDPADHGPVALPASIVDTLFTEEHAS